MVSSGKNILKISRWVIILKEGALPSSLKEIKSILLLREKMAQLLQPSIYC